MARFPSQVKAHISTRPNVKNAAAAQRPVRTMPFQTPCVPASALARSMRSSKDDYNRASIDYSRCISCGACVVGCPFGAITDRSNIVAVIEAIKSGDPVIATFAPAIEGHFGDANVGQLKAAIRKLGFTDVVEVPWARTQPHGMRPRNSRRRSSPTER